MGGSADPTRVVAKCRTHVLHYLSKLGRILNLETCVPEFGTCVILTVVTIIMNASTKPGNASTTLCVLSMSPAYFSLCSTGPPSTGLGRGSGTPGVCPSVLLRLPAAPSWPRGGAIRSLVISTGDCKSFSGNALSLHFAISCS